jgi:hypothetical protein
MDGPNRVLNSRIRVQDKKGKSPQRSSSDIVGLTNIFILRGDCVNRRKFLQNCSLAPLMALPNPGFFQSANVKPIEDKTPDRISIFLHGMMLLHFDDVRSRLLVTAPEVPHHDYYFMSLRPGEDVSKERLEPMVHHLDWTRGALVPGRQTSFPKTIMQFSTNDADVGAIKDADYRFRIVLPLPTEIIGVRIGKIDGAKLELDGNVGEHMHKSMRENGFALVTCLQYRNSGSKFDRHHVYAEPTRCDLNPKDHTNKALDAAGNLFEKPKGFDVRIKEISSFCIPPSGPDKDAPDSYHLCEVLNGPISCQGSLPSTGGPLCSPIVVTNP